MKDKGLKNRTRIIHKNTMTDEDLYLNLKVYHKQNPKVFMNPDEWKKQRLEQLKKEGRNWIR